MYGESISEMLNVQYRMHAAIMDWSSHELYNGKLTAHASVASHTLETLQASLLYICHLSDVTCRCSSHDTSFVLTFPALLQSEVDTLHAQAEPITHACA